MAESDKIPQIDPSEIEVLIQKIEQNKLDERERRLIVSLRQSSLDGVNGSRAESALIR